MKKTLATLFLIGTIGILGCVGTKIEYSQPKRIDGIVIKKEHLTRLDLNSKENINHVVNNSIFYIKNDKFNEEFNIFIETKLKKYIISNINLYNQLKKEQKVDLFYEEVYKEFYKDIDKDGKKEMIKRNLVDFEFISANPRKD